MELNPKAPKISNRDDWVFGDTKLIEFPSKEELIRIEINKMLNKTINIIKYDNLPDNIDRRDLELQLQCQGHATFAKPETERAEGRVYSFVGGLGGEPNAYYLPTLSVVANPYLRYNKCLKIHEDCVVVKNDYFYAGMLPMYRQYATMLAEAYISLRYALINTRMQSLAQADNDTTAESAKALFDKIVAGEGYGAIGTKTFFEGLSTFEFNKMSNIKDIIESIQYIKGSWYNELGLEASFNMKREAINEAEASMNEDTLYPNIDTMLECRQRGIEEVNKMFGLNIKVRLDSIWDINRKEDDLRDEILENEAKEEDDVKEPQADSDRDSDRSGTNGTSDK